MPIIYHSEYLIRSLVLMINRKRKSNPFGDDMSVEKVEAGALCTSSNKERKAYFEFAAIVVSLSVIPVGILFIPIMLGCLALHGITFWLLPCMPFFIPPFVSNSLDRKAKQCDSSPSPVRFLIRDLVVAVIKAELFVSVLVVFMLLVLSGNHHS